jgi:hypothetical protein
MRAIGSSLRLVGNDACRRRLRLRRRKCVSGFYVDEPLGMLLALNTKYYASNYP